MGLDFLLEQEATIDLVSMRLRLKGGGCDLPLRDSTPLCAQAEWTVRAADTIVIPPCSILDIEASLEATTEGVWLLQEAMDKCLLAAVACALVELKSTAAQLSDGVSDYLLWHNGG